MTCQQAEPFLARAAEGTLDVERPAALASHLATCADCRDALEAQRTIRAVLAGRPEAPVPLGFATRVMAGLNEREPGAAAGWLDVLNWRAWTLRLAPLAGALFVGATIGLGPSTEIAPAGAVEFTALVTAWVTGETTDGEAGGPTLDTMTQLWQDGAAATDDLLLDVLLAEDPGGTTPKEDEVGR